MRRGRPARRPRRWTAPPRSRAGLRGRTATARRWRRAMQTCACSGRWTAQAARLTRCCSAPAPAPAGARGACRRARAGWWAPAWSCCARARAAPRVRPSCARALLPGSPPGRAARAGALAPRARLSRPPALLGARAVTAASRARGARAQPETLNGRQRGCLSVHQPGAAGLPKFSVR